MYTTRYTSLLAATLLLTACSNPPATAPTEPPPGNTPPPSNAAAPDAGPDANFGVVTLDLPEPEPLKPGEPRPPGAPALQPPAIPSPKYTRPDAAALETYKASREGYATWLNDGRQAVVAKKYPEGIKLLRQGLAVRPDDPAILGELGWALFLSGDLDQARRVTLQGLGFEPDPHKRAAMLYNLGRIAEASKNPAEALQHYQRSLALRDNAGVKRREAALSATPATEATLQSMCREAMESWSCTDDPSKASSDDFVGTCTCQVTRNLLNKDGFGLDEATILSVSGSAGEGGSIDGSEFLAVKTRTGGWQLVTLLTHNFSPGVSYIHNAGTLHSVSFQPLTSTLNALAVYYENREDDGDYSENINEWTSERTFLTCFALDGFHCLTIAQGQGRGRNKMLDDEGPKLEGAFSEQWGMFTQVDGKGSLFSITVDQEEPPPEGDYANLMGVHAIQMALTKPGVVHIPLR